MIIFKTYVNMGTITYEWCRLSIVFVYVSLNKILLQESRRQQAYISLIRCKGNRYNLFYIGKKIKNLVNN